MTFHEFPDEVLDDVDDT